jgi:transcriptional regulator with XRE-family HTH domain
MQLTPDAVRELRKALGITQQDLAVKLGMAVSSISHFETGDRTPDGSSAMKLYRAAQEANRQDLADVFGTIINDAMGHLVAPIRNADEHRKVRALQHILFDARFAHLREPLAELLAPVEAHLRRQEARKARARRNWKNRNDKHLFGEDLAQQARCEGISLSTG